MARVFDLIDSSGTLSTISLINTSGIVAPVGGYGDANLNARHLMGDDPTESGRVLETYKLMLRASSQDNAASQYQALLAMLRKAARYGKDPRQTAPVYIKQQLLNETSPRYAICYGAYELVNPNLFRTIFDSKAWIEEFGLTLIREHPWRSGIPGTLPTATTLTVAERVSAELVTNGGFETAGGGGADVFGSWAETPGWGSIADETTLVHSGSHAAKLDGNAYVLQQHAVTPGATYQLSLWTRGDGTHDGQVEVYDVTNGWVLLVHTMTGVAGTAYTQMTYPFTAPAGCTEIGVALWGYTVTAGIAYFDDVSVKQIMGI
jgi:hypothetical protein